MAQQLSNPLLEEPYEASGAINPLLDGEEMATPAQANPLLEVPTTEPPSMPAVPPAAGGAPQPQVLEGGSPFVRGKIEYPEEEKDPLVGLRRALAKEQAHWDKMLSAETPAEALGITGAAEIAGGVAVGGAEWLAQNIMGMSAGVYTKFATDWSGRESLEFGNKVSQHLLEGLKDVAPDAVQRFLGKPETLEAQQFLEGMGTLLETTVGKLGDVGAEFVGGYIKGIANYVPEGYGKQALLEAVPWAEQLGRFGVELLAFKKGHEVGRYVARKVRAGKAPSTPETVDAGSPDIVKVLREDFQPAEAARRVAEDIDATLSRSEKAELRATAKEAVQRTFKEHDLASIEEDLRAGTIGPDIAKTLRENVELQDQQFAERAKVEKASDDYIKAIDRGDIPVDSLPAELDPATNMPIPFGNRAAARVRATSYAKEGVIAEPVRVPGTKLHALRLLEEERVIRSSRDKPLTLKGAEAKARALKSDGISTELRNVESGYELIVTGYTKEAALKRAAEIKAGEPTQLHAGISPEETVKRLLKRVGSRYDLEELTAARAKWLEGVEEGRRIMAERTAKEEARAYNYAYAGIPIPPELAGKIRRYAREHGVSVLNLLRKKGYTDETAGKMVAHIERMGEIYENNLASGVKVRDTNGNRAALRKRALMLAESHGLLTTKPIKKGRPVGQFSIEEVNSFLTSQDLPLSTPLREATRRMKRAGLARQTQLEYKDRGFKSFVEATAGKPWGRDLNVNELTALGNAMARMHKRTGQYILKQEGGRPPITEAHLDMLGKIAHVKLQGTIEGTTWFAERLDKSAPGFAREFIYPVLTAENNTVLEVMIGKHRLKQFLKENKITKADREAIGAYAVSKQAGGDLILERMGKKAEPLTPNQAKFYNYMRTEIFEPLFTRINETRAKQGQSPISYTENYFTFFRDLTELAEDGIHVLDSKASTLKQRMTKARQVSLGQLKSRVGSKLPVELDAAKVAEKYMLSATHYVNTSPPLNAMRNLIESSFSRDSIVSKHGEAAWPESVAHMKAFKLGPINTKLYDSLNSWLNYVAGVPIKDAGWAKINKAASVINSNLAYSILSFNLGSTMRQFGAWRHVWFGTSMRDMIKGCYKAAEEFITAEPGTRFGEKAKLRGAFLESDRLAGRVFDATARHTLDVLEGKRDTGSFIGYLQERVGRAGLYPLQATDAVAARVSYYAFESKGKRMGLRGQDLKEYIDNNIIKTQGSGARVEVPPILRTPLGRTLGLFQTYVLNEWNYLNREILGRGSKRPTLETVGKVIRYIYITAAMSSAFEALGIRSPFPTPIDAFTEAKEKGASTPEALVRAAFELAEPIPFGGGAVRFQTTLGGPFASITEDVIGALHNDPFSPPLLQSAAKLFGVPGTTAFYNGYRTLAKDTDDNVRSRRGRSVRRRTSRQRR